LCKTQYANNTCELYFSRIRSGYNAVRTLFKNTFMSIIGLTDDKVVMIVSNVYTCISKER